MNIETWFERQQRPLPEPLRQVLATRRQQMFDDPRWLAWRTWAEQHPVDPDSLALDIGDDGAVVLGHAVADATGLANALREFMPWRKGPFVAGGVRIDAEWRSELKWERALPFVGELHGRSVCDIGSGNGYYAFRAAHEGARHVLALDPTPMYNLQFHALSSFAPALPLTLEPAGYEECEFLPPVFDQVWLWGILYHHPDPVAVMQNAARLMRRGGRLIVETIVVDGPAGWALVPARTYTLARGFWLLPTVSALHEWVRRADLEVEAASEPVWTTPDEQRVTEWRTEGDCLADGLDPSDPTLTVEGYPAPQRIFLRLKRRQG